MQDRTGELCPSCKKGKLLPCGPALFSEQMEIPYEGEVKRESTEYECDVCHEKFTSNKATMVKSFTANATIIKDDMKNEETKDQ